MSVPCDPMARARYTAILLAGSRGPDDPMARCFRRGHKCLIEVAGRPMIAHALATLASSPRIRDVVISIERRELLEDEPSLETLLNGSNIRISQAGSTISRSVERAIGASGGAFPFVLTTADHALLTNEMLDHVCAAADTSQADILIALARSETIEARYPETTRTYLRFADGQYSGCNLYVFNTAHARKALDFWRQIERRRKSPWRLVRSLGVRALWAYVSGRLSTEDAMTHASRMLRARIEIVDMPFAEAAIDIDRPDDLKLVEQILAKRAQLPL